MKKDLSQELDVIIDVAGKSVTASTDIAGKVIKTTDYNDIMVCMEADITAGKIGVKVETASNADFDTNVVDITDKVIKPIIKDGEIHRENEAELAALYFTSGTDKKEKSIFGIYKELCDEYIKITYQPDGSAAVTTALNAVVVMDKKVAPTL